MEEKIIMAGFGGQGIMMMGQLLTQGGMDQGYEVSWFPSYGPEMRGGTASCHVIIGTEPIGSPVVTSQATAVIVMNQPSLEKFLPLVAKGGHLLINSSLIEEKVDREDLMVHYIPCSDLAQSMGNAKIANMIMLGALTQVLNSVSRESIIKALKEKYVHSAEELIRLNALALEKGAEFI